MLRSKGAFTPENVAKALKKPQPTPPEPPPPPTRHQHISINFDLSHIVGAASWAWGAWRSYREGLAQQDQQILQLAEEHFGWLTVADIMKALGLSLKDTHRSLDRLIEAQLCEHCTGKDGKPIYIFPQFLPRFALCSYCQVEHVLGITAVCTCCGAPLPE